MIRLLLSTLLLAGCSAAPPSLPPPDAEVRPVTSADRLEGRWTIAALNGRAITSMWLDLRPGTARYNLACNGGQALWSRNGDKLSFTQTALTEIGCEPARMQADEQAMAVLRQPMIMELTPPDRLRLVNAGGTLDLVRTQGVN